MDDYAPGLPKKHEFGDLTKLRAGQLVSYVLQDHHARRAGRHRDLRLGTKNLGMYSWAMREPSLPKKEGDRVGAFQQPLHTYKYKDFEGKISSGYGAGTVVKQEEGKALITRAEPNLISFVLADKRHPIRYALAKTKGKDWLLLQRKTPKDLGAVKPKMKSVTKEELTKLLDKYPTGISVQPKVDGAMHAFKLERGRVEALSHRISKVTGDHVLHTERLFGGIPLVKLPRSLNNTVVLGETYGVNKKTGKIIPQQELSGILNSNLDKALTTQKQNNIELKTMLFDVVSKNKKDVNLPYEKRVDILQQLIKYLPKGKFELPHEVRTKRESIKLLNEVEKGKHPLTSEGLIIRLPNNKPVKYKTIADHDVYIRDFFDASKGSKYEGNAVGGFYYSETPRGPIVGRVGGGIIDKMRRDMYKNPDKYIGRVARIESQGQYEKTRAHRSPQFINLHQDY